MEHLSNLEAVNVRCPEPLFKNLSWKTVSFFSKSVENKQTMLSGREKKSIFSIFLNTQPVFLLLWCEAPSPSAVCKPPRGWRGCPVRRTQLLTPFWDQVCAGNSDLLFPTFLHFA